MSGRYDDELALALELADLADAQTLPHYVDRTFTVHHKDDRSEVTEVDRGTEATIRSRLATARPDHAVLGEEEGLVGSPDATDRWIVDPIDGTSNFVKGLPVWATLIALEHDGELVVGVASAPALGRRWWAVRGGGAHALDTARVTGPAATLPGRRIHVSDIATIAEAHLAYSDIGSFTQFGRGRQLTELTARCWRARGLGDFWMHVLVAEGAFDAAMEPIVNLWDLAAIQVIVEEAGGTFTNLEGEARADGGSALSSNGRLHTELLAGLRK